MRSLPLLAGFCYTQFADTYQEANGLLYADRTPKFPIEQIALATRGPQNAQDYQIEWEWRERLMNTQRQQYVVPLRITIRNDRSGTDAGADAETHDLGPASTQLRACSVLFWIGGFECSMPDQLGRGAPGHDRGAAARRLCRGGLPPSPRGRHRHSARRFALASDRSRRQLRLVDAGFPCWRRRSRRRVQVIWDLFHYGWPDDLDIFSPEFVDRFARFAREAARIHREHRDEMPFYSPMNEISFFAWAATRDLMFPYAHGRDGELKRQLVRADIAAVRGDPGCGRRTRALSLRSP